MDVGVMLSHNDMAPSTWGAYYAFAIDRRAGHS